MKTMTIALAASMLLVAVPFVTAEESCGRAGATEAIPHPGKAETYLFLDLTQPEKVGEWVESNRSGGLQTVDCFKFGTWRYGPDTKVAVLG